MFEGGHRGKNSNADSVGREVPLKGGVFKIEISKVSGSALAAEICTGPHNRLLRRQHCSSLCSQSEGHEHVANMTSALGHDFVGFSARAWPPQYSPPSLCEQSELQCFAPGLRQMSARCPFAAMSPPLCYLAQTRADIFLYSEYPTPMPVGEHRPRCERTTSQIRSCLGPDAVVSRPRFGRASAQMRRQVLIPIIDNQLIGFVGWFVRGVLQKKRPEARSLLGVFIFFLIGQLLGEAWASSKENGGCTLH